MTARKMMVYEPCLRELIFLRTCFFFKKSQSDDPHAVTWKPTWIACWQ